MTTIGRVSPGDRITVEREWENPILEQAQATLQVYYRESNGTQQFWNGSAFTTSSHSFNMTADGDKWYYILTVPSDALGEELILEAKIDGEHPIPESHFVVTTGASGSGTPTAEFS